MAAHEALHMPAAVVGRIVKDALPGNAAVSKEARTAIGRAAAIFVMHLATNANEYAISKKRKMITPEDVYQGVRVLECDHIEKPLREAVEIFKATKAQKSEELKRKKAAAKTAPSSSEERVLSNGTNDEQVENEETEDIEHVFDDIPETQELSMTEEEYEQDESEANEGEDGNEEDDLPDTVPVQPVRDIEDM